MRALTTHDLLQVWEWGEGQHPVDQALVILSVAFPEKNWEELARLSLGRRDGLLLALRERIFGPRLAGFVTCPQCRSHLEFSLEIRDLPQPVWLPDPSPEQTLTWQGIEVHYRIPNSLDLEEMAKTQNLEAARNFLLQQVLLHAQRGEIEIPIENLPPTLITTLAEQIVSDEPFSEIQFRMHCPTCSHQWLVLFDVMAFFWVEIAAFARRVFREVHTLARAFGWREADILAMSPNRRQIYLNMVSG